MRILIIFFGLMPYIGTSFLPTDIQPVFIFLCILALIYSFAIGAKLKIDTGSLLVVFMLSVATISFLLSSLAKGNVAIYDLRALFGYLTAVVVFIYFVGLGNVRNKQFVTAIDLALWVIGLGFLLNILGLTSFIQIFVSRAEIDVFASNRGLTSFFPEQSRVSTQMIFFGMIYLMFSSLTILRLLILLFFSFLSASGQMFIGLAFLTVSIFLAYTVSVLKYRKFRKGTLIFIFLFSFICVAVLYAAVEHTEFLIELGFPQRGIRAINMIADVGIHYVGKDFGILYKVSGFLQGITTLIVYPMNFFVGFAYYMSADPLFHEYYVKVANYIFGAEIVPYPRRSFSVFGNWVSDFGVLGLLVSILLFYSLLKKAFATKTFTHLFISLLIIFNLFFLFVFRSNSSDPTFWLVFAVFLCVTKSSENFNNRESNV